MRRRCHAIRARLESEPARREVEHNTLKMCDRADPRFASIVLVDGYQRLRIGDTSAVAVTAYSPPDDPPVTAPPPDPDDYVCVQYMMAKDDEAQDELVWMCDVSYERYPEVAYLLGGRLDRIVAMRMRSADLLLVVDSVAAANWTLEDVRLVVPNDSGLWTPWS
jgi:hypothetical protein